jgi:hypothetical protein
MGFISVLYYFSPLIDNTKYYCNNYQNSNMRCKYDVYLKKMKLGDATIRM